jgi:hypothetical protein
LQLLQVQVTLQLTYGAQSIFYIARNHSFSKLVGQGKPPFQICKNRN